MAADVCKDCGRQRYGVKLARKLLAAGVAQPLPLCSAADNDNSTAVAECLRLTVTRLRELLSERAVVCVVCSPAINAALHGKQPPTSREERRAAERATRINELNRQKTASDNTANRQPAAPLDVLREMANAPPVEGRDFKLMLCGKCGAIGPCEHVGKPSPVPVPKYRQPSSIEKSERLREALGAPTHEWTPESGGTETHNPNTCKACRAEGGKPSQVKP